jgi:hypothetical protein
MEDGKGRNGADVFREHVSRVSFFRPKKRAAVLARPPR